MRSKREDSNFNSLNVLIFAAPKDEVIKALPEMLSFLRDRRWNVLDVIMLGDTVKETVLEQADIAITLGGDGTILYASRVIDGRKIPILGINFGRIGLLTELTLNEFYKNIRKIETKNYSLADIKKIVAEKIDGKGYIPVLNEYVIITSKPGKVIGLNISINSEHVADVISDGLILSTPLGSSSYSLSVGGPLLYEEMGAMIIAPLAPLFRAMYPLVVPLDFTVTIELSPRWADALLVADGVVVDKLERGTVLMFKKADQDAYFIRLKNRCYRLRRVMNLLEVSRRFEKLET